MQFFIKGAALLSFPVLADTWVLLDAGTVVADFILTLVLEMLRDVAVKKVKLFDGADV